MYARLYETGIQRVLTDDQKYSCPSLPIPRSPFVPYTEETVYNNREYFTAEDSPSIVVQPSLPKWSDWNPSPKPHHVTSSPTTPQQTSTSFHQTDQHPQTHQDDNDDHLLPVLDCRFNLREICKQSILLEDHLSHEKKRCTDCCIKHFLALEGLCEEAVTLDKDAEYMNIRDLANKIRELQKLWYHDPEKNSHYCSQELRKLRKQFQMKVFPIIFDNSIPPENSCSGGTCRLKK